MKALKKNEGFTMLELLAVLAIVLILSAILFPAIESARERSLATACSQNVKQLVLAITQYEQDKGQFPPGVQYVNASGVAGDATDAVRWYNAISPYMSASPNALTAMGATAPAVASPALAGFGPGEQSNNSAGDLYPDAYRCPSAPGWDVATQNMSYGYNYQYLGDARPLTIISGATGFVNFPVRKGAIQRADRTIAVADSDGTGFSSYISAASLPTTQPAVGNEGAYGYLLDPTFLPLRDLDRNGVVPNGAAAAVSIDIPPTAGGLYVNGGGTITLDPAPVEQQKRSVISDRHKGQANVGFLDGHVELMDRGRAYFADSTVLGQIYPSNALWNGFGVDNDLTGDGTVDSAQGERVLDNNECYYSGIAGIQTPQATVDYLQGGRAPSGNGLFTGLSNAYQNFGIGFDINVAAFLTNTNGPTLFKKAPLTIPLDNAAAVQ